MTQFMAVRTLPPAHPEACPGCAGDGMCWVCLGAGNLSVGLNKMALCHRCNGSGACVEWRVTDVTSAEVVLDAREDCQSQTNT